MRRLDRAAGRMLARPKVLVEARTPMNLAVLEPVYSALLLDSRLDVFFTGPERHDLLRALAASDLGSRVLSKGDAKWTRIDLAINADPWEAARLRRASARMNFFHGVAGKYDLDCPEGLPLSLQRYDRIAFPNEGRMRGYLAKGLVRPAQAALVGYPKVDRLAWHRGHARDAAAALGLDGSRPTAIFAPPFSPASALHVAGETIVETLLGAGCNVIVKLHDRSLDPDPRFSGGVDWRARLARFASPGRFLFADGADSNPYVVASDLMVSDHSSIAFEFCVLDRPIIVFDAPELASAARINPAKLTLLRSAALVAHDADSLARATARSLDRPDALASQRRRAAEEVFHRPGTATARALRIVYELLDLAPASTTAVASVGAWSLE